MVERTTGTTSPFDARGDGQELNMIPTVLFLSSMLAFATGHPIIGLVLLVVSILAVSV
jgi:hypothetical protein